MVIFCWWFAGLSLIGGRGEGRRGVAKVKLHATDGMAARGGREAERGEESGIALMTRKGMIKLMLLLTWCRRSQSVLVRYCC